MPIKYAEITISINLEQQSWLSYIQNLIGEENIITENDTIIISFDDGTITDTKSAFVDKQFSFGFKNFKTNYPIWLKKSDSKAMLFLKGPTFKNGFMYMNFNNIFKDEPKYATIKKMPSIYNTIYYSLNKELFSLIKNGNNQCYLLAYDDDYFDKSDINYLIHTIFTNTFKYNEIF